MKAILVIDMPNNCEECNIIYFQGHGERSTCDSGDWSKRPSWCPLRPLPERKDVPEYLETNRDWEAWGYDQCIAEILGSVATGETE